MKRTPFMLGAFCALLPALALAQPDVTNAPKAENPPNRAVGGGNNRNRRTPPTPEQLKQMAERMAQIRAQVIRQTLTRAGFTDEALQSAVVDYAQQNEDARAKLMEKWTAIQQALRANTVTDAQLTTLLNDFRASVDEEKSRRDQATKALDAKIEFSKKPKLDATLMVGGLTGDEAQIVNGSLGGFGAGGFGGFGAGGFGAGGFGGFGGNGAAGLGGANGRGGGGFTPFGFGG